MTEHTTGGVGEDTFVECIDGVRYGPANDAVEEYKFCPYCGEPVDDSYHEVVDVGENELEVFCDNTVMSTYRYCPECGKKVRD